MKNLRDPIGRRPPVSVSLGVHARGAVLPRPADDPVSAASGAMKRIATDPGKMSRRMKRQFARFVERFCKRWLIPLDPTTDLSVEGWLSDNTTYSASRKQALLSVWNEGQHKMAGPFEFHNNHKRHAYRVNNFIKDEFYAEYKHPRMINSRSDMFKCVVGPLFSAIAKDTFNLKFPGKSYGPLIKYVPVSDRPVVLRDLLTEFEELYQVTDYSSFEAHFTAEVMETCEFQLYKHMTSKLPNSSEFMDLLRDSMCKVNTLRNKWFRVLIDAVRMSGEMNTSLGNGFSNMMFTLFQANQTHLKNGYVGSLDSWISNCFEYVRGVFEGDDGLCVFHPSCRPTSADFQAMGMIIKLEDHKEIGTASFCGNVFDPIDMIQVCDPLKVLCSMGWSNKKYVRATSATKASILRCKANSYINQYPGCPIVQALSLYVLRVTSVDLDRELRYLDNSGHWAKGKYRQAYDKLETLVPLATPGRTRDLVERMFQVPPECQIEMENWFHAQTELVPIDLSPVWSYIPELWKENYNLHVSTLYDEGPIITLDERDRASTYLDQLAVIQPTVSILKQLI